MPGHASTQAYQGGLQGLYLYVQASEDALDLLSKLVAFDPRRRPSAAQALAHRYFATAPPPTTPSALPRPPLRAHHPLSLIGEVVPHSYLYAGL